MNLSRIILFIVILAFGLSTVAFAQPSSKTLGFQIVAGGLTIAGPSVYEANTGESTWLYAATDSMVLNLCITFWGVEGESRVTFAGASPLTTNPHDTLCRDGVREISMGCRTGPCSFVYRIDKAN